MNRTAVVTGGSSGVGRATALRLVKDGWRVAIVGTRADALNETIQMSGSPDQMLACPCDLADAGAVAAMTQRVSQTWGFIELLVAAAGTNIPNRSLEKLSLDDYRRVIDVNLNGVYFCVHAFLPAMRQNRRGTIVVVNSLAGLRASALSGVPYSVSKFGAAGLVQSINAEENGNGIRATSVFPGDINTPLLDKRPNPPAKELRLNMLQPDDVTDCVMLAVNLPQRAVIEEIMVRPCI
ncbi:MAG TPA: SDR family oxidoreductase [Tepidisphaeraceae bacterium]|nr:SDR family oxidoreductase [Tepidisphaeraceae bacterium]